MAQKIDLALLSEEERKAVEARRLDYLYVKRSIF